MTINAQPPTKPPVETDLCLQGDARTDPLLVLPTDDKTVETYSEPKKHLKVNVKLEEDFEDIVEEETFESEDEDGTSLVVKNLSSNEQPILVMKANVLDE